MVMSATWQLIANYLRMAIRVDKGLLNSMVIFLAAFVSKNLLTDGKLTDVQLANFLIRVSEKWSRKNSVEEQP